MGMERPELGIEFCRDPVEYDPGGLDIFPVHGDRDVFVLGHAVRRLGPLFQHLVIVDPVRVVFITGHRHQDGLPELGLIDLAVVDRELHDHIVLESREELLILPDDIRLSILGDIDEIDILKGPGLRELAGTDLKDPILIHAVERHSFLDRPRSFAVQILSIFRA